jgi:lipoate-protein ligase A
VPRCRVWTYGRDELSAVVLGCSQHQLRPELEQRIGGRAELVERDSGGGAVLTGPWLVSASIVLPQGHPWVCDGLIESYRHLGKLHVTALSEIGVTARALPPWEVPHAHEVSAASATRVVDWACFGGSSAWEVVDARGRKLVGLAQRRRRSGVLLVAGTLIGSANWSLLCDVMGHSEDASKLREGTTSGEEVASSSIEPDQFAYVLMRSLTRAVAI